ncbi:hypothetical protein LCGC14_0407900 [marine sediment metagenome]|jgi:nucleoid DNA-binding protein|uniref:Uncharacterized protein n=1 Tax=marine sediment metagenome TaxID=412755 RepID=A0A0F9W3V2_9ZZZZ
MTEHQWRAPAGVRALGRACSAETLWRGEDVRSFAQGVFNLEEPAPTSPTFEARAKIWRDQANGLISIAEAQRRSAAIGAPPTRAKGSPARSSAPARPRHSRPAPNASRQYAGTMATTAARDDRLTPNAKAMLQVIRARCGKGRETSTCKATLGSIMSRSARTIRRYLVDLVRWGYLEVETRRTARGLHTGLVIRITEKTLPFFAETKGLARWLAETEPFKPFAASKPAGHRVTFLTPKNESQKDSLLQGKEWLSRTVMWRPPAPQ